MGGSVLTPDGPKEAEAPRPLTRAGIQTIVAQYTAAAAMARAAGFDGVELHAANGY